MMFAEMHFFDTIAPKHLDNFLAKGWFRMNQSIFTTHFLQFNQQFYSAIWLRIDLDNYVPDRKYLLLKKINSSFRTEIKKAVITQQQEELYALYKEAIDFEPATTLQQLLFGTESDSINIYNSYEVNVYDGGILIATGFFDLGNKSAAGISCFYHPAYKKHSLGKYLMFLKIDFCRQQELEFFYPGYLVPGYPPFEYKASIGKRSLEYFAIATNQWLPYSTFLPAQGPLEKMEKELKMLQTKLTCDNIETTLMYYRFFDANLYPSCIGLHLFDYPVFLIYKPAGDISNSYFLTIYNVSAKKFHIVECVSIGKIDVPVETEGIFGTHLLKLFQEWLVTDFVDEIANVLKAICTPNLQPAKHHPF